MQFGLLPEYVGQGLGKSFLHWAVAQAWSWPDATTLAAHVYS